MFLPKDNARVMERSVSFDFFSSVLVYSREVFQKARIQNDNCGVSSLQ